MPAPARTPAAAGRPERRPPPIRVLTVPGLHGSGPDHWQTWLEQRYRGSVRVEQHNWAVADLDRWAGRIDETLAAQPAGPWIAAAHSFGCLALLHHLARRTPPRDAGEGIVAALLAAPAEPARFGVDDRLVHRTPLRDTIVIASRNDPWMSLESARRWARCWDAHFVDLGEVGHINPASGFGPWPFMRQRVERQIQRWHASWRLDRAAAPELSFAV